MKLKRSLMLISQVIKCRIRDVVYRKQGVHRSANAKNYKCINLQLQENLALDDPQLERQIPNGQGETEKYKR